MNRARTEAMLSGCCVIQVEGAHDLERFFHDGEDIILCKNNDPDALAKLAHYYVTDAVENALEIGKEARKNAIKHFNYERYGKNWLDLLKSKGIYKE